MEQLFIASGETKGNEEEREETDGTIVHWEEGNIEGR
jgi:hypothetical protein